MEAFERSEASDALHAAKIGGASVAEVSESPLFSSPTEFIASLFPLLVLFVCVSAISSSSAPFPGSFSLLHPASSLNALRLHLEVLRHHAPSRFFSSTTFSTPFLLSFILPYLSFFLFRLLPLFAGSPLSESLPALAFSVSYPSLFSQPATAGALNASRSLSLSVSPPSFSSSSSSAGASTNASAPSSAVHAVLRAIAYVASFIGLHHVEDTTLDIAHNRGTWRGTAKTSDVLSAHILSPLLRLLLHPTYLSRRSLIFWLLGGPFLLYSCILHIYLHHRDISLLATDTSSSAGGQPSTFAALRLVFTSPRPALRATVAVAVCFFMPSVIALLAIHWFADPEKGTLQAFQYVGLEGTIYALTSLVALYDPVVHSGMFSTARLQYVGPFHVRNVTSLLTFVVFLFAPPPSDLYVLFGGIVAAGLAAAAAAAPPLLTLFGCTTAAALLHPAILNPYVSVLFTLPWSSDNGRTWSAGGLALILAIAAATVGVVWKSDKVLLATERSFEETHRLRGRLAGLAVLAVFVTVPFSYAKPPTLRELLLRPRRTA